MRSNVQSFANHFHPASLERVVLDFLFEHIGERFVVVGIFHVLDSLLVELVQALTAVLDDALQFGERGLVLIRCLGGGLLFLVELGAFLDKFRMLEVNL